MRHKGKKRNLNKCVSIQKPHQELKDITYYYWEPTVKPTEPLSKVMGVHVRGCGYTYWSGKETNTMYRHSSNGWFRKKFFLKDRVTAYDTKLVHELKQKGEA
jgi:hypothetical protein